MNILYQSTRRADGNVWEESPINLTSVSQVVRKVVSCELLFGTRVELKESDEDGLFHTVTLTTNVLGSVDTVVLHLYITCPVACGVWELCQAFASRRSPGLMEECLRNDVLARRWIQEQVSGRNLLGAWLVSRGVRLTTDSTEGDMTSLLELYLEGYLPSEINTLV